VSLVNYRPALYFILIDFYLYLSVIEKHSLYYIYTGLSKPVDLPGIYDFTAMGLLDQCFPNFFSGDPHFKVDKSL